MTRAPAILSLAILSACTNPDAATQALQATGYKDIAITGYSLMGCGEGYTQRTGFAATSVAGSRVTGTVCGGLIAKGSVIHIEGVE